MSKPSKIVVGSHVYRVLWSTADWAEAVEGNERHSAMFGLTDTRRAVIAINPLIAETMQRETFLHEVLHACEFYAGMIDDSRKYASEEWITRLSPVLLDALLRNPAMRAYLLG